MEIRAFSPSSAYNKVLQELLEAPWITARGLKAREIPERVHVIIEQPYGLVQIKNRKLNHAISVVEGLSLVGQTSVPELQINRVGVLQQFMSGGVFRGSYGPRVEGSLSNIVRLLDIDKWSRQAVLSIYDSQRDLGTWNEDSVSGDIPCTVAIQFMIRDDAFGNDRLQMWVMMRSNDAWRGLPYDLGQFVILHNAIAQSLGVEIGYYTHSVGSMHLYDEYVDQAKEVVFTRALPYQYDQPWPLFGAGTINEIAGRARKILLGMTISQETGHEHWMSSCLSMADHKQVLSWP